MLLALAVAAAGAALVVGAPLLSVPAASADVKWTGRTVPSAPSGTVVADWVGVSATVTVSNNASWVAATISDSCHGGNKFVVWLTGEGAVDLPVATFYTRAGQAQYTLFASAGRANFVGSNLTVRLVKAVEARFTQCAGASNLTFVSFESDAAFLPPPPPSARRIEVIGDSISAGDLVICSDPLGRHMPLPNSLWADDWAASYGSLLAARFGADVSTVAWGGMGLVAGDVPSWTWPSLPDVWPSALAWEVAQAGPGAPIAHPWTVPAGLAPGLVVINLGTNDASGGRFNNASFAALFQATYAAFVRNVSAAYAAAGGPPAFLLAYGPMSVAYKPAVLAVVAELAGAGLPVHALDMTLPHGLGCGHPSAADHLEMALAAVPAVAAATGWA